MHRVNLNGHKKAEKLRPKTGPKLTRFFCPIGRLIFCTCDNIPAVLSHTYRYSDRRVPLCIDVLNANLSLCWENGAVAGATGKLSTNECDLDKDGR